MLNPSTADATHDDPTIRRCLGFATRWEMNSVHVVNLFAFRATDPDLLATSPDPIGPENLQYLEVAFDSADCVIAAWGASGFVRVDHVAPILRLVRHKLFCLGRTKSGAPRHPVYVRADTMRQPFELDHLLVSR